MEIITDILSASLTIDILLRISAVLFICFSTNYRNGKHNPVYYILAAFVPLIGVIVFAVKRKEMNGAGMKKCPSCGRLFPPEFAYCYVCNVELAPYDARKSQFQKILATLSFAVFVIVFALNIGIGVYSVVSGFGDFVDEEAYSRIAATDENGNEVYFDRNGDSYSNPEDVALFTKDGKKYVYSNALDRYTCTQDGSTLSYYNAYVDMDGYLIEDKNDSIYLNPIFSTSVTDDEEEKNNEKSDFDSFVEKIQNIPIGESSDEDDVEEDVEFGLWYNLYSHPYYENPFSDDDGNFYFEADVASWTKEGKLIKSAEDITK